MDRNIIQHIPILLVEHRHILGLGIVHIGSSMVNFYIISGESSSPAAVSWQPQSKRPESPPKIWSVSSSAKLWPFTVSSSESLWSANWAAKSQIMKLSITMLCGAASISSRWAYTSACPIWSVESALELRAATAPSPTHKRRKPSSKFLSLKSLAALQVFLESLSELYKSAKLMKHFNIYLYIIIIII